MQFKRNVMSYSVAVALVAVSGTVAASGFALKTANGLGNAFAGGAASAEDASTIFFNPAGMSLLNGKQIVVAAQIIKPSAKFYDNGTSAGALLQTAGGNGGDAGSLDLIPNGYFAMEINQQLRFGLGVFAPFGLQTQYDANWIGRFQAIRSEIETINLNPSVSYQVNDRFSVGAGVSYQRIKGDLTSAVNYSAAAGVAAANSSTPAGLLAGLAAIAGAKSEGVSTISGRDSAWGYNIGALFNVNPQARVGVAYRSRIKYDLSGTVSFTPIPAPLSLLGISQLQNGAVILPITMPDSFSLSGFHRLNDKWDVMADVTWIGWDVLQQLKIDRADGTGNVQTVHENWKNTWRVSAGANYHHSAEWVSRMGVAYDQSPVPDVSRNARLPDNDSIWLSFGVQYKPARQSAIDIGYSHLFVRNASISDKQQTAASGGLIGTYSVSEDVLKVQFTQSF